MRLKLFKRSFLILALGLLCPVVTGCRSNEEGNPPIEPIASKQPDVKENIRLTVWAPLEEQTSEGGYAKSLLKTMCKTFAEEHPEWNISFTYGVCEESRVSEEFKKGLFADVFMFDGESISRLIYDDLLLELNTYKKEIAEANNKEAVAAVSYNNVLYGIPFAAETDFMYYDKSFYTEEEAASLDKMLEKNFDKGVYNVSIPISNGRYMAGFFLAAGCMLFDERGGIKTNFTDGENKVISYLDILAKNKKFLPDTRDRVGIAYMKAGRCGAVFGSLEDAEAVKDALAENYAVAILPSVLIDGEEKRLISFGRFKYIGVNKQTEYKEAAEALAVYLGSEECQKMRFLKRKTAPTNKAAYNDGSIQESIETTVIGRQLSYVQFFGNTTQAGLDYFVRRVEQQK